MKLSIIILLCAMLFHTRINAQFNQESGTPLSIRTFDNNSIFPVHLRYDLLLGKRGTMRIELENQRQLYFLPQPDSLFTAIKQALFALKDSFVSDLTRRRSKFRL